MSVASYLFSPKGRFRRADFHFVMAITTLAGMTIMLALAPSMADALYAAAIKFQSKFDAVHVSQERIAISTDTFSEIFRLYLTPPYLISLAFSIFFGYIALVATIKRFHDIEKSGWNSLHIFFPIHFWVFMVVGAMIAEMLGNAIAVIYALVVLYLFFQLAFVPGSPNDTRFGPSPYDDEFGPTKSQITGILGVLVLAMIFTGVFSYRSLSGFGGTNSEIAAENAAQPNLEKTITEAAGGNARAQYDLSFFYATGTNGLKQDPAKALEWLGRSARQGHLAAQYNLGVFYATGKYGRPIDHEKGYFWLTRARMGGYVHHEQEDFWADTAKKLTPQQIEKIEKEAQNWAPALEQASAIDTSPTKK